MGIGKNHTPIIEDTVSTISIADWYEFVKTHDESFTPAPEVSKYVLNEDGTPKVLYHGTHKNFTTFELQDKPTYGRALEYGFYLTSSYVVTFNIRDKGKDQYLIDFKEDKTPGLSNTAVKKLVGADLSYNYYFIFLTFNISQKIFIFF